MGRNSERVWSSGLELQEKAHVIRHLRYSPDGKLLAIGTTAGLYLFDLEEKCDRLAERSEWPGVSSLDFRIASIDRERIPRYCWPRLLESSTTANLRFGILLPLTRFSDWL